MFLTLFAMRSCRSSTLAITLGVSAIKTGAGGSSFTAGGFSSVFCGERLFNAFNKLKSANFSVIKSSF